jgi:hypothetical protein
LWVVVVREGGIVEDVRTFSGEGDADAFVDRALLVDPDIGRDCVTWATVLDDEAAVA